MGVSRNCEWAKWPAPANGIPLRQATRLSSPNVLPRGRLYVGDRSLSFFSGRGGSGGLIEPVVPRVGVLGCLVSCLSVRIDVVGGVIVRFGS
jgi:hypothetical protein